MRPHSGVLGWEEMLSLYENTEPWIVMPVCAHHGFYNAAVEAGALADGATILAQAVGLNDGLPVSVRYLGEGTCSQGAYFHAFMFSGPTFDALVWTEDDLIHGRLARRGDLEAFQKAEVSLRLYEDRTLAHLRMEDG